MKQIMIIKRNGESEPFSSEKIQNVIIAAGVSPIDSEELLERIISWVESLGESHVSSLQIRDRLFEELEKTDRKASGLFAWHQNLKQK